MTNIKQNLNQILTMTVFFLMVNGLNLLNSMNGVSFLWKLSGAIAIVLFIAGLKTEENNAGTSDKRLNE